VRRIVRYELRTGEVIEIIEVPEPHKAAEYKLPTGDELRPKAGCRFKGKQPLGRVASPQSLFTRVRGREILLSWRGAAEGGIMSLVQGKHTAPGVSLEGP
jgi:hypothetical protein